MSNNHKDEKTDGNDNTTTNNNANNMNFKKTHTHTLTISAVEYRWLQGAHAQIFFEKLGGGALKKGYMTHFHSSPINTLASLTVVLLIPERPMPHANVFIIGWRVNNLITSYAIDKSKEQSTYSSN